MVPVLFIYLETFLDVDWLLYAFIMWEKHCFQFNSMEESHLEVSFLGKLLL